MKKFPEESLKKSWRNPYRNRSKNPGRNSWQNPGRHPWKNLGGIQESVPERITEEFPEGNPARINKGMSKSLRGSLKEFSKKWWWWWWISKRIPGGITKTNLEEFRDESMKHPLKTPRRIHEGMPRGIPRRYPERRNCWKRAWKIQGEFSKQIAW